MRIMPKSYHLIGIGGCGMRALAKLLLEQGHTVTGSDIKNSKFTEALQNEGATIFIGQSEANVSPNSTVVLSSAITEENPELIQAKAQDNPIMRRAELLAQIMASYEIKIAIAGTHGKTSTTTMLVAICNAAGHAPGFMIGADTNPTQIPPYTITNAAIGNGKIFITEADESDGTFLEFPTTISAITNIEDDHLNFFKTRENIQEHFLKFMENTLKNNGKVITNSDDKITEALLAKHPQWQVIKTGTEANSPKIQLQNIQDSPSGITFKLTNKDQTELATIKLQTHGRHNAMNAMTATAIALECGIPINKITEGLANYAPVGRRFQQIHNRTDTLEIKIIDDYAHHPTEIKTTIKTAKGLLRAGARLITIFQPHRYTRTQELLDDFATSFNDTDIIIITEVYAAGEPQNNCPGAKELAEKIQKTGKTALLIADKSSIIPKLLPKLQKHDTILTIGAGDINTIADKLSETLSQKTQPIAA